MRVLVGSADLPAARAAGGRVLHRYPAAALVEVADHGGARELGEPVDGEVVWVHGRPVPVPAGLAAVSGAGPGGQPDGPRVLARFAGPIAPQWTDELAARGVRVAFWCPPFGACLDLPAPALTSEPVGAVLAGLSWLAGAVPYTAEHCRRPTAPAPTGRPELAFADAVCFSPADRAAVHDLLDGRGLPVLDTSRTKLRVLLPDGDVEAALQEIRDLVGVKLADRARPARPLTAGPAPVPAPVGGTDADRLGGCLAMVDPSGQWIAGLDGAGEVVAVADTGLDTGDPATVHPDLAGRVDGLTSWPINSSWSAVVSNPGADDGGADLDSGHGTFVAGVAVGDGAASGGRHRGVAPAARLVFQAIEQYAAIDAAHSSLGSPGYYLAGRPLDLRDLLAQAAAAGAAIHVLAWGDPARGGYPDTSYEVDLYLHEYPEALVLVAAGNSGSDQDADREVDPGSLDAPATGKNVLTIGATEGPVYGVGYRGTWAGMQGPGRSYPDPADQRDGVSGDPDTIALFSSAGPTADGRTKPDLVAPGTNIAGPRSSRIPGRGWGYADHAGRYMYLGGTSVAVGVAGGFAAVLRQQWRAQTIASGRSRHRLRRPPSGPALKAIAVAGAVSTLDRAGDRPELRRVAGYGGLSMQGSLPEGPEHTLLVLADGPRGLVTGARRRWTLTLPAAGPLRAVLAWYDAPGERLVNDLDLRVDGPAGLLAWGNHPPGQPGQPDRLNTVEVVDLPDAPAGVFSVTVTAFNVPAGRQPFALVVRGPRGTTAEVQSATTERQPT